VRFAILVLAATLVAGGPAVAETLALNGATAPGGLLTGKVPMGSVVKLGGKTIPLADDGSFLVGFGRDAKGPATLDVRYPDGSSETKQLSLESRTWNIQRIDGLPKRKVTPAPADLKRIKAEKKLVRVARMIALETRHPFFASGFAWPVTGRVSGVYGSQRILNGQPRRPHFGTDVAAPDGTPVKAMADGLVAVAHQGMFFNGKTVILDHGLGLTSAYIHMSAVAVKAGDRVTKGQSIGAVGATGRATGPHLHWGVTLRGTPLDPALLVGPMRKPE